VVNEKRSVTRKSVRFAGNGAAHLVTTPPGIESGKPPNNGALLFFGIGGLCRAKEHQNDDEAYR
jgi:hypothetical protein